MCGIKDRFALSGLGLFWGVNPRALRLVGISNWESQRVSKNKPTPGGRAKKKAAVSMIRSSAAEYLSFVAAGGNSENSVEMRYEDENVWLTQKKMAALYDISVPAINQHLKIVLQQAELLCKEWA